ncbi:MAG: ABC transporter permease [Verrucomicrobiota bacterium]
MAAAPATTEAPPDALAGKSLGERTWLLFRRDRRALFGLGCVGLLIILAVFAPLLAENKPIVLATDGGLRFPLFATLTGEDWRFLFYGIGSTLIVLLRHKWSGRTGLGLVLGLVLVTEVFCANWQRFNDITDYRELRAEGTWMLLPPVPYSPYETSAADYAAPSPTHWLGTDGLGRDLLSRIIHGARPSLLIGFFAQGICLLIGCTLGAVAGFYRGWVDLAVSRVIETFECFPTFFFIITIIAFVPRPELWHIMLVIGITSWPGLARLVRGEFLKLRARSFTQAALAAGANDIRVMLKHIFPNTLGPVLVATAFGVAAAILVEASLAFLGFGVPPPYPTWGSALSEARVAIDFAWWLATFPGLAIFVTITAYNLLGEALRDAIDPTSERP